MFGNNGSVICGLGVAAAHLGSVAVSPEVVDKESPLAHNLVEEPGKWKIKHFRHDNGLRLAVHFGNHLVRPGGNKRLKRMIVLPNFTARCLAKEV